MTFVAEPSVREDLTGNCRGSDPVGYPAKPLASFRTYPWGALPLAELEMLCFLMDEAEWRITGSGDARTPAAQTALD